MRRMPLVLVLAVFTAAPAGGTTIRIPLDFSTVQEGIQAASDGDTVLVYPGPYPENLSFLGKEIVVGSRMIETGDPAYIDSTFLEPGMVFLAPIVSFTNGEGFGAVLTGFTIRNGTATNGGGVSCSYAFPKILKNRFVNNTAHQDGGGVYIDHGGPTIADCAFEGNRALATDGGGVYAWVAAPIIHRSEFFGNYAGFRGAGIYCEHSDPTITDNVIHDNLCADYYGGGIASRNCASIITGNVIHDNRSVQYGGGLFY
ncbi:MAG: right-handed parallel beta-helix repeat-containing protein [Candidatus Eisenbacteria bacterium]